jgi:hypothetical protein
MHVCLFNILCYAVAALHSQCGLQGRRSPEIGGRQVRALRWEPCILASKWDSMVACCWSLLYDNTCVILWSYIAHHTDFCSPLFPTAISELYIYLGTEPCMQFRIWKLSWPLARTSTKWTSCRPRWWRHFRWASSSRVLDPDPDPDPGSGDYMGAFLLLKASGRWKMICLHEVHKVGSQLKFS